MCFQNPIPNLVKDNSIINRKILCVLSLAKTILYRALAHLMCNAMKLQRQPWKTFDTHMDTVLRVLEYWDGLSQLVRGEVTITKQEDSLTQILSFCSFFMQIMLIQKKQLLYLPCNSRLAYQHSVTSQPLLGISLLIFQKTCEDYHSNYGVPFPIG